jgi:uncharacterized membrane protein YphA (DoxX/SURF4 family)
MFVVLRLSLGFHFLYEGIWKIKHADIFSAAPFLTEAKGPVAPLFYAMLPDLEGRERLGVLEEGGKIRLAADLDAQGHPQKDDAGRPVYRLSAYVDAWKAFKDRWVRRYKLSAEQSEKAEDLCRRYCQSAREYVAEHADEMVAHFESRRRFAEEQQKAANGAAHQLERDWKRERALRGEVNVWLAELDTMGKDYQAAMGNLLDSDQQARGPLGREWNPLSWPRIDQINFAVTYGLTAIGACLVLGLCTRLAAIGGGLFMLFVVMTQPAWPGLYPPDPAVVGHALLVNKDFVEMVALFLLATSAAGRWGGLDFFLHRLILRPLCCRRRATTGS